MICILLNMSMIEKFVEVRINNFIKEFDIDINCFGNISAIVRSLSWEKLRQKFIKHNLVDYYCGSFDCYLAVKNYVWKNIMVYYTTHSEWHVHMYHNNYRHERALKLIRGNIPYLSDDIFFGKYQYHYPAIQDNCHILQTKIINYIMLLDILVTEHMISDLVYMFKIYIFDVILVL